MGSEDSAAEVHEVCRSNPDGDSGDSGAADFCDSYSDTSGSSDFSHTDLSDLGLTACPSRALSGLSDLVQDAEPSEAYAMQLNKAQETINAGLELLKGRQYRKAEDTLSQALDELGALHPPPESQRRYIEGYIGICRLHLGRTKSALDFVAVGMRFREYLHEDDDRLAVWMLQYADGLMEHGKFASAAIYIDKALRLCDQTGLSSTVLGIRAAGMAKQASVLLMTGDFDHAELFATETVELSALMLTELPGPGVRRAATQGKVAGRGSAKEIKRMQHAPAKESHRLIFHADALILLGLVFQRSNPNTQSFEMALDKYREALEYLEMAKQSQAGRPIWQAQRRAWAVECLAHYRLGFLASQPPCRPPCLHASRTHRPNGQM